LALNKVTSASRCVPSWRAQSLRSHMEILTVLLARGMRHQVKHHPSKILRTKRNSGILMGSLHSGIGCWGDVGAFDLPIIKLYHRLQPLSFIASSSLRCQSADWPGFGHLEASVVHTSSSAVDIAMKRRYAERATWRAFHRIDPKLSSIMLVTDTVHFCNGYTLIGRL
jgi:hypothetical protein